MIALRLAKNRVVIMPVLRALIACALMAGSLVPVYAQDNEKQDQAKKNPLMIEQEMRQRDGVAIDQQYKATLQRTRKDVTETRPTDPWQSMRGTDDSKTKR